MDCDGDQDVIQGTATCTDTHYYLILVTEDGFPITGPDDFVRHAG